MNYAELTNEQLQEIIQLANNELAKRELEKSIPENREIREIRFWSKGEHSRVYITFENNDKGCYHLSGSPYYAKGTLENITKKEKENALSLCEKKLGQEKKWCTVYASEITIEFESDAEKGYPVNPADYF